MGFLRRLDCAEGVLIIFFPLRVSKEDEYIGLNVSEHNASTEILDLFKAMDLQAKTGDLSPARSRRTIH